MFVTLFAVLLVSVAALLALAVYALPAKVQPRKGSVQIVVLGDIGRSPRMQYHALSVVQNGGYVDFVGYQGKQRVSEPTGLLSQDLTLSNTESDPITELQSHPAVKFHALSSPPRILQTRNKLAFAIAGPLKVLFQVWDLWSVLAYRTPSCEWLLLQNPPSIPTLLLAIIACYLRSSKLVIDWHNFGYSILALKLGDDHPLVKISKVYEQFLGRYAHSNFAVTNAMCDVLRSDFGITRPLVPLHDRPAPIFVPLTNSQRIAFLTQSELTNVEANDIIDERTRLVVSSTSWTADEDFSVLLDALSIYSASATSDSPHLPELLVVITGKGPLRDHYRKKIDQMHVKQELEMVSIKTEWLSFEDYAALLGAADLGVSLHTSSSGVDLPMKVVDMFGAGLPVLGYSDFRAWPELVQEDVNGKGFTNADQMSNILKSLFEPTSNSLAALKQGAITESKRRWASEWLPVAGQLFGLSTRRPL